jgi:hypothetical protein
VEEIKVRWWRLKSREKDLQRELESHLELEAEEQRESGLPPDQARYAAQGAFGNAALIKEEVREGWGWTRFGAILARPALCRSNTAQEPGFHRHCPALIGPGYRGEHSDLHFG